MEREACVCDHGFERSDLCAETIIIIIIMFYVVGRSSTVSHTKDKKTTLAGLPKTYQRPIERSSFQDILGNTMIVAQVYAISNWGMLSFPKSNDFASKIVLCTEKEIFPFRIAFSNSPNSTS